MQGKLVTLRPATADDIGALAAIRATPEVSGRWPVESDPAESVSEELDDDEVHSFTIIFEGTVAGYIQFGEEPDPMYRHASIDLYLDPAYHSRGIGTDAVQAMVRFLIADRGHHRLVIDPAADNAAAIRAYTKAGFRPVGVMRRYERGPDGEFHDGLLMELLAEDVNLS